MSTADHRWIKLLFSHTHPPGPKPSSNPGFVHKAALYPCASHQPHLFHLVIDRNKGRWKEKGAYCNTSKDCSISSNSMDVPHCLLKYKQHQTLFRHLHHNTSYDSSIWEFEIEQRDKNPRKLDIKYRLKLNSTVFVRRIIFSVNVHKCNSSILIVFLLQHIYLLQTPKSHSSSIKRK